MENIGTEVGASDVAAQSQAPATGSRPWIKPTLEVVSLKEALLQKTSSIINDGTNGSNFFSG